MSNSLRGKVKKKFETQDLMETEKDKIFAYKSHQAPKKIYNPIPIRGDMELCIGQENVQDSTAELEANLIAALLNVNPAEKFVSLNILSTLLRNTQNSEVVSTLESLTNSLHATSNLHSNSGCKGTKRAFQDLSQLEITEKYLESRESKRKMVRKQTSFAMTDVKSECNSTNEKGNQAVNLPHIGHSDDSFYDSETNIQPNIQKISPDKCMNQTENSHKKVGLLTASERMVKVQRYLDKKKRRKGEKAVRYECRQNLASKRFRYQGRFIRFEDLHKYKGKLIIDYAERKLIKPIFQITKVRN
ncbi:unnamed protein product [Moneuplotes crassus]|uniref:CCT domain-containing protein n=1 Tax=Euplotes crassus TaxID=5936 RepID=A0AAD2CZM0_EUPCR|nr:unnamed protein product [Moneuplotes crassus]